MRISGQSNKAKKNPWPATSFNCCRSGHFWLTFVDLTTCCGIRFFTKLATWSIVPARTPGSAVCRCSSESNRYFESTHTILLKKLVAATLLLSPLVVWAAYRQTHKTPPVFLQTPMLLSMLHRASVFSGICQAEDNQTTMSFSN